MATNHNLTIKESVTDKIITQLYYSPRKKSNDGQNCVADLNTLPEDCQETLQERKKRINREAVAKYR